MDYLFVPGTSDAELRGRAVISRRANTTLITLPAAKNHVAGLLARLATLAASTPNPNPRPIGDILLVAHGLQIGDYYIRLSRTLGSPADFEKADDANTTDAVRLTAPRFPRLRGARGSRLTFIRRRHGGNSHSTRKWI